MLSRLRLIVPLLLLLLAAQGALSENKALAKRIDKILADPAVARGLWGVEVVSLDSGQELYGLNANKLFTPASNTKLFTTAAALALIGPNYRFRTTVETSAMVDKYGRLTGDLVLVGRGDPNLSGRVLPYLLRTEREGSAIAPLEELADQLVQKGLKFVDGDVVADDSFYVSERYGEGWAQDDLVWEWGAPVSALSINDNVIFLSILPADRPGERAFLEIIPYAGYYQIDNRVLTTPAGTGPRRIYLERDPGSKRLTLWGNIPADDPGDNQALAIEDPPDFAAQVFRSLLEKRSVVVDGGARVRRHELANLSTFSVTALAPERGGGSSPPPGNSQPLVLASHESQPLADDLRVINKVSQNLHAELLLRLLAHEKGTAPTIEGGLEVMRGFLTQAGIQPEEYVFYDGSGLSRQNLATPHAVAQLLQYASRQPWGALYQDTLPVAGVDGSLSERFTHSAARQRVQAKTGSLGHVNALSGYATTPDGEHLVFSILVNNHNLPHKQVLETIDAMVDAMMVH